MQLKISEPALRAFRLILYKTSEYQNPELLNDSKNPISSQCYLPLWIPRALFIRYKGVEKIYTCEINTNTGELRSIEDYQTKKEPNWDAMLLSTEGLIQLGRRFIEHLNQAMIQEAESLSQGSTDSEM
ncbi:MAG: hypothetical protein SFT81_05440 [Candidatus Caenarcaniphilales bacterium]|nr:hypothetical protein [Candidatus Caenarcaniphilales bacterium]